MIDWINLQKIGIAAAMQKHVADPKTEAMKIVIRKMKNWSAVRCKPVIKYAINENTIDGKIRMGSISQISLEIKNVVIQ